MWRRTEIYRENIRTGERRWGVVFENYERQLVCSVIGFAERKDAAAFVLADEDVASLETKDKSNAQEPRQDQSGFDSQARQENIQDAQPGAGEESYKATQDRGRDRFNCDGPAQGYLPADDSERRIAPDSDIRLGPRYGPVA